MPPVMPGPARSRGSPANRSLVLGVAPRFIGKISRACAYLAGSAIPQGRRAPV
jgi:hypothetical protein